VAAPKAGNNEACTDDPKPGVVYSALPDKTAATCTWGRGEALLLAASLSEYTKQSP